MGGVFEFPAADLADVMSGFPTADVHAGTWFMDWDDVVVMVDWEGGRFRVGVYRVDPDTLADGSGMQESDPSWFADMVRVSDVGRTLDWIMGQSWHP